MSEEEYRLLGIGVLRQAADDAWDVQEKGGNAATRMLDFIHSDRCLELCKSVGVSWETYSEKIMRRMLGEEQKRGDRRYCQNCGALLPEDDDVCEDCGLETFRDSQVEFAGLMREEAEPDFCHYCGRELEAGTCPECGRVR